MGLPCCGNPGSRPCLHGAPRGERLPYADRGSKLVLKASTTKGGRPREIPVVKDGQRRLRDEMRALVGGGALIPAHRNYREQLRVYETQAASRAASDPASFTGLRGRPADEAGERWSAGSRRTRAPTSDSPTSRQSRVA